MTPVTSTPEFTVANLLAIDAAIQSGARMVKYGNRTVEYQSVEDMMAVRALIYSYLSAQNGQAGMPTRQLRVFTTKGF